MKIRPVTEADAPALLAIYAPYVTDTAVTFEYTVPSPGEFAQRIRRTLADFPYLCAEEAGVPLGYAYASHFRTRAAYAWTAESSVYVRQDQRGRGSGTALQTELERLLRLQRIHVLTACITWPNPDSVSFHLRHGFRECAHFHRCGYKLGQWLDMIWMEKDLLPPEPSPEPFLPRPETVP